MTLSKENKKKRKEKSDLSKGQEITTFNKAKVSYPEGAIDTSSRGQQGTLELK
jgi:hypothetical protein